jgi:uncharacterized repeat protein (TIGR03833 family)
MLAGEIFIMLPSFKKPEIYPGGSGLGYYKIFCEDIQGFFGVTHRRGICIRHFSKFGNDVYYFLFYSLKVKGIMTDGQNRAHIKPGQTVSIVLKKDQKSGILTQGRVKTILTKSPFHPNGIKVRLENGLVGRVKIIHI